MLYRATYYSARNQFTGETTFEVRILPTLRAVELWAQTKLQGAHVTTTRDCYHRDVVRAPSVTWQTTQRKPVARGEILPPVSIVPSVGELGYF